jgi:hypothetical protein
MTDYAALKIEIAKPEYDGLTDVQCAALVNSKTVAVPRDVSTGDAITALVFTTAGDWGSVCAVADGVITAGVSQATRVRCVSIRELFIRGPIFRATNATHWAQFISAVDVLITDGRMSAEGKAALEALGRPVISLALSMGWPGGVGDGDIAAARVWVG